MRGVGPPVKQPGGGVNRLMKLAITAGSESAVRMHISRGDDLEWRDDRGFTPLMIAASRDRAGVCALLMAAGVDRSATDLTGRDALAIARDAGAQGAARAIEEFTKGHAEPAPSGLETPDDQGHDASPASPLNAHRGDQPSTLSPVAHDSAEVEQEPDDYGDWEQEDEVAPPTHDPTPVREQSAIQRAISDHVPIDDSADWDDVEAYLPEAAAPFARDDDAEFQVALRALVLRAAREGSVPTHLVEDLYSSGRGEDHRDRGAELSFQRVVNDIGAEIDDRFEYASLDDDFRVAPGPAATWTEAEIVDEAIAALASLAERPKDPLRMQRRQTQRLDLLTAEQEIELAKAMESASEAALDALAGWPVGLEAIIQAIEEARAGRRFVTHIAASGSEEGEIDEAHVGADSGAAQPGSLDDDSMDDAADSEAGSTDAMAMLERLAALRGEGGGGWPAATAVRAALGAIDFRRTFLLDLSDLAAIDTSLSAKAYRAAIADLRTHRDRMTVANLRMVFPIVRKYLFSGMPLEDLSQEGNIGLMKAVDRFDWRRGFRFSTMATWWVRQAVSRSIADSVHTIRLPVHAHEAASRFKHEIEALEALLGREPMPSEVADRIGMPLERFEAMYRCVSAPLPLDSAEREIELEFERPIADNAFASAEDQAVARTVATAVASLGKKNATAIRLRFGLDGVEPRTLEEVGSIFGVTRERARQIEAKALRILSHPRRLQSLGRALGMVDLQQREARDQLDSAAQTESEVPPTPSGAAPSLPLTKAAPNSFDVAVFGTHVQDV